MRNKLQTILIGIGLLWGPIIANSSTINTINVGSSANDGTGDTLRAAFQKVNSNDAALNADKVENSNGSASGLTLSGTTTIGGTLDVSSATTLTGLDTSDEIAQTVTNGKPSLRFDSSFVQVPSNTGLRPGDGANVDYPQSIAFWVKADDWSNGNTQVLAERHSASRGYQFYISGAGEITYLKSDGTENVSRATSSAGLVDGQWYHIVVTDPGIDASTPSSVALDGIAIYINGDSQALASATEATYEGIGNSSTEINIGGFTASSSNLAGEIPNAQIFQSALSAADVETIYRSGVPYELDQATAGGYVSDFTSDSVDGWSAGTYATLDAASTVGGDSDNLKIVSDGTASQQHGATRSNTAHTSGKRFRMTGEYYLPSGQTAVDGFIIFAGGSGPNTGSTFNSLTTAAWTSFEFEGDETNTSGTLSILLRASGATTFNGVSGEYIAFRNIRFVETGCILDLDIGATDFSVVSDNIPDRSGNSFEGTLNSMSEANGVGFPTGLYINNPSPSANQNLIVAENAGTQVFSVDEDGDLTIASDLIITNSTTPASASDTGTSGTIAWDASYIYICTAANTWKRVAISTW